MSSITFNFSHPEQIWDVLVVGGGAAGVFAAIAAAKNGAKTLLIEKNSVLGGTITTAGVNFPGLFHAWGEQIIGGPCWDAILRTVELGGATIPPIQFQPVHHYDEQISVNEFIYSYVLDESLSQSGAVALLHTTLGALKQTEDGILVLLAKREGLSCIKVKTIVDATGDAAAAAMMGYPRIKSTSVQPATLIHDLTGYDPSALNPALIQTYTDQWIAEGQLKREDFQGNGMLSSLKAQRIYMHLSGQDADSSEGKTLLEQRARQNLMRIIRCIKKIPGLENLTVSHCALECGVRETFRIVGEKTITAENYINGVVYDDAVCYSFYPIDRHIPEGIYQVFLKPGIVPTIPYGALIPQGSQRLLAAGRCISGDADASSAYRVQASCMAIGQVAGTAAAMASRQNCNVQQIPYKELCDNLQKIGAIVPDAIPIL